LDHVGTPLGRKDDIQRFLAIIAVQRRIEAERRRKAWAATGYPYAYQQAEETAVQTLLRR